MWWTARNSRVQKFTLGGKYISQFGSFGSGPGELNTPWGIGLDEAGNIFIADWRNDRVQSFTNDGQWLASFGQPGTGGDASVAREHGGFHLVNRPVGLFNRPTGVCVDKDGDIYVADWLNNRVQVLTPEGRFITEFTGDAALSKLGEQKIASNPDMIRQRNGVRDFTPGEGSLGPRGSEGGRRRPSRHRRHHAPPLPGLPEERRASAGLVLKAPGDSSPEHRYPLGQADRLPLFLEHA